MGSDLYEREQVKKSTEHIIIGLFLSSRVPFQQHQQVFHFIHEITKTEPDPRFELLNKSHKRNSLLLLSAQVKEHKRETHKCQNVILFPFSSYTKTDCGNLYFVISAQISAS